MSSRCRDGFGTLHYCNNSVSHISKQKAVEHPHHPHTYASQASNRLCSLFEALSNTSGSSINLPSPSIPPPHRTNKVNGFEISDITPSSDWCLERSAKLVSSNTQQTANERFDLYISDNNARRPPRRELGYCSQRSQW